VLSVILFVSYALAFVYNNCLYFVFLATTNVYSLSTHMLLFGYVTKNYNKCKKCHFAWGGKSIVLVNVNFVVVVLIQFCVFDCWWLLLALLVRDGKK